MYVSTNYVNVIHSGGNNFNQKMKPSLIEYCQCEIIIKKIISGNKCSPKKQIQPAIVSTTATIGVRYPTKITSHCRNIFKASLPHRQVVRYDWQSVNWNVYFSWLNLVNLFKNFPLVTDWYCLSIQRSFCFLLPSKYTISKSDLVILFISYQGTPT